MAAPLPDRYTHSMEFRAKLLSTLKAVQSVLNVPGVMVIGSEVPNLLQPDAASNLTVLSLMQGVDGMPDPRTYRTRIASLLRRLEELEVDGT